MKYYQPQQKPNPTTQRFIFATGIEYSYPSIRTPQGVKRQDELEQKKLSDPSGASVVHFERNVDVSVIPREERARVIEFTGRDGVQTLRLEIV